MNQNALIDKHDVCLIGVYYSFRIVFCIVSKTVQATEDAGRLLSGTDHRDAVIRWGNGCSLGTFQNAMPFRKSGSFG